MSEQSLWCEFCNGNHEFQAGEVEQLVYALTEMVRDADVAPLGPESVTYCLHDICFHYAGSEALYKDAVTERQRKRKAAICAALGEGE